MTRSPLLLALTGLAAIAACSTGSAVPPSYLEGTSLDRHEVVPAARTEYLEVALDPRDSQLRLPEIAKIENFIAEYRHHGHGPLIISMPSGVPHEQLAVAATAQTREIAWQSGLDYQQMHGGTYDGRGAAGAPLILAFKSYEAVAPDCPSLAMVSFSDGTSNNDMPTLGCAVRTNFAAMIADPADLLGTRELDDQDSARRTTQLENWRNGEVTGAARGPNESTQISGAVN